MTVSTGLPLCPAPTRTGTLACSGLDIRLVEQSDLPSLVRIHLQQFPDGFYARLGPAFMARYFQQYFRSSGAIGLVAEQRGDSALGGYLVGTVDDDAHDRCMYGPASPALAAGAVALAARPAHWPSFVRASCSTSARCRRVGVGAALLRAYVDEAQRTNASILHLVSEWENVSAHDFYAHRGWRVASESVTRDGRPLVGMRLSIPGATE